MAPAVNQYCKLADPDAMQLHVCMDAGYISISLILIQATTQATWPKILVYLLHTYS